MACSNAAEWDAACEDKIWNFQQMGVYNVVPRPKGHKVVGSKWVLHIKHGPDGQVQKYKACIVTQGFTCYSSFDLSSIYAVKYHLTMRICLYQLSFLISMIPGPHYCFPAVTFLGLCRGAFSHFPLLTKPFPSRDQPPIHLDHMTNHLTSHLTTHITSHMPFQSPAPQSHLSYITRSQVTCTSPDTPSPDLT